MSTMSTKTVTFLATAAAAVAVAVSGCTQTVAGHATVSASEVAEYTAEVAPTWITVPSHKGPTDEKWHAQYGPTPTPGIAVTHDVEVPGGEIPALCTLGPAVASGDQVGMLTAGHCVSDAVGAGQYLVTPGTADGKTKLAVGVDTAAGYDSAPLWMAKVGDATTRIGEYPVAGVLSAQYRLDSGTPICVAGAITGLHCGKITIGGLSGRVVRHFVVEGGTVNGDSGAPVFLVTEGRQAVLVGTLVGGDEFHGDDIAVPMEPVLEAIGARACLSPDVEPLSGEMYSTQVTSCSE